MDTRIYVIVLDWHECGSMHPSDSEYHQTIIGVYNDLDLAKKALNDLWDDWDLDEAGYNLRCLEDYRALSIHEWSLNTIYEGNYIDGEPIMIREWGEAE